MLTHDSLLHFFHLKKHLTLLLSLVLLMVLTACGGSSTEEDGSDDLSEAGEELRDALNLVFTDADFTLIVEAENGSQFIYSRGFSSESTVYQSASTSKMVTAAVMLWLVEEGYLELTDNPQDYISFWPTTGDHADIQLSHLLSFTSGLISEPFCLNNGLADFEDCVETILDDNPSIDNPGDEFYYASTHMQVAGLMAVRATGSDDWEEVFDLFQSQTGLFRDAEYDLPSTSNPRLAGGMHWQGEEYIEFLEGIYREEFLNNSSVSEMSADQVQSASIGYSPGDSWVSDIDWRYGYGVWIECDEVPFDCTTTSRISSAGAYGAYPFIDFEEQYFGIIARQGFLGSGESGYLIYEQVKDELEQWARDNR